MTTAEEFLQNHLQISYFYDDKTNQMVCYSDEIQQAMIEFAKLHVKAALKSANKKAYCQLAGDCCNPDDQEVNKESILNSYSLDNIK